MKIKLHSSPTERAPKTRRELLGHLWAQDEFLDCNIFKEGPKYAARVGRFVCATGLRCIDSLTYSQWEDLLRRKREETSPVKANGGVPECQSPPPH